MLNVDLKKITTQGIPYENFLDGIKNPETKRHYTKNLARFLKEIPLNLYKKMECAIPDKTVESQAECFVKLCEKDSKAGTNIIAEYIKYFNRRVSQGKTSPNSVPNYTKPIKILLDTNDVPLHWKRLYHLYPRVAIIINFASPDRTEQKSLLITRSAASCERSTGTDGGHACREEHQDS